jgi:hypothetical protein
LIRKLQSADKFNILFGQVGLARLGWFAAWLQSL